jgi:hypothetical protein
MKTEIAAQPERLEDIPNIGKKIAGNLRQLGYEEPAQLRAQDPYAMYDRLCALTGTRHDPCLLDTFIAAVRFMHGAPAVPWWAYTAERKRELAARDGLADATQAGPEGGR